MKRDLTNPFLSFSNCSPFSALQVHYKKDYEKNKAHSDYNTLPATENPLLRQLRYAGTILSDVGIDRSLHGKEYPIVAGLFKHV